MNSLRDKTQGSLNVAADNEHHESELLMRIIRRDLAAFETFYYRQSLRIGRYLMKVLKRPELVDEEEYRGAGITQTKPALHSLLATIRALILDTPASMRWTLALESAALAEFAMLLVLPMLNPRTPSNRIFAALSNDEQPSKIALLSRIASGFRPRDPCWGNPHLVAKGTRTDHCWPLVCRRL